MYYVYKHTFKTGQCIKCNKPLYQQSKHNLCINCYNVHRRFISVLGKTRGEIAFKKFNPPKQRIGALITI